jgi:hypothetical protein
VNILYELELHCIFCRSKMKDNTDVLFTFFFSSCLRCCSTQFVSEATLSNVYSFQIALRDLCMCVIHVLEIVSNRQAGLKGNCRWSWNLTFNVVFIN